MPGQQILSAMCDNFLYYVMRKLSYVYTMKKLSRDSGVQVKEGRTLELSRRSR